MACEHCELLSQLNGQTVDYYACKIYYPYWRFSAASTQRGTPPLSSWNFKGGACFSNLKAGGLLFPHPAFVKQGNKRAVIPTHIGATPGHSWSQAHGRCEEHSMPSLPVYSSLYLANEMETWQIKNIYIHLGIYWAGNHFQNSQFVFNFSSLSSEWSGLKLSLAVI